MIFFKRVFCLVLLCNICETLAPSNSEHAMMYSIQTTSMWEKRCSEFRLLYSTEYCEQQLAMAKLCRNVRRRSLHVIVFSLSWLISELMLTDEFIFPCAYCWYFTTRLQWNYFVDTMEHLRLQFTETTPTNKSTGERLLSNCYRYKKQHRRGKKETSNLANLRMCCPLIQHAHRCNY